MNDFIYFLLGIFKYLLLMMLSWLASPHIFLPLRRLSAMIRTILHPTIVHNIDIFESFAAQI